MRRKIKRLAARFIDNPYTPFDLAKTQLGIRPDRMATVPLANHDEYLDHLAKTKSEAASRRSLEQRLAQQKPRFLTPGFCAVCGRWTRFVSTWAYAQEEEGAKQVNWREELSCYDCHLNNRKRAAFHLLMDAIPLAKHARIYLTEQTTDLYINVRKKFAGTVGSEYLGDSIAKGHAGADGIRNEDLTQLTFAGGEFDAILSLDVIEHIPDFKRAFAECARVLKPGGKMLWSVPFDINSVPNKIRARLRPDGSVEHLLPPEYHVDRLNPEGCLCFQHFGWEMLEEMKEAGFSSAHAVCFYSPVYGYIGGEQLIFVAEK